MVNVPPWMSAGRELRERQRIGAVEDGNDEAVVDGHGEADVDVGVLDDRAVLPRDVHARMLGDGRGDQSHEQVRVGDVGAGLLARLLQPRRQATHVCLAHQIEVGRRGPARRHTLGHDAPDVADALRGGCARRRGDRRRLRRRDVAGEDGAAGAGAAHHAKIDAALRGETARLGRRGGESRGRRACGGPVAGRRFLALDVGENVRLLDTSARRRDPREIDAVLLGELAGERRGLHGRSGRGRRRNGAGRPRRRR